MRILTAGLIKKGMLSHIIINNTITPAESVYSGAISLQLSSPFTWLQTKASLKKHCKSALDSGNLEVL